MGFSWSLFFDQNADEYAMKNSPVFEDIAVMQDRSEPCALDSLKSGCVVGFACVDSVVHVSLDVRRVQKGLVCSLV